MKHVRKYSILLVQFTVAFPIVFIIVFIFGRPAQAQDEEAHVEEAQVLSAIQQFFDGMAAADSVASRAVLDLGGGCRR